MKLVLTRGALAKTIELGMTHPQAEAMVEAELEKLRAEGLDDPLDLAVHTFAFDPSKSMLDDDVKAFWMLTGEDDHMVLSTGHYEEVDTGGTGNFGPGGIFEGLRAMFPVEDEEIEA